MRIPVNQSFRRSRQKGVALITALIIMLILTLLGVTAMNMTTLEEKMAFNAQDRTLARYLAESVTFLVADDHNLPGPAEPGLSFNSWTLSSSTAVTLPSGASVTVPGLEAGTARITYVQNTPAVNLPFANPRATKPDPGGNKAGRPVYEMSASATTAAETTAGAEAGYYYFSNTNN